MQQQDGKMARAALILATQRGGQLLMEQLTRGISNAAIRIMSELFPTSEDEDDKSAAVLARGIVERVMVESIMDECFNPRMMQAEHTNQLGMAQPMVKMGYNRDEPLCYTPVNLIIQVSKEG